jgi:hypothetical protein
MNTGILLNFIPDRGNVTETKSMCAEACFSYPFTPRMALSSSPISIEGEARRFTKS